jgi:hypothetical protein
MERGSFFAQETSAFELPFMTIRLLMLNVLPRIFPLVSSCSITTGGPTSAMTWGTRGSARLRRFEAILRETFVRLVPSIRYALTNLRRKIWLDVQWYFSGKDIAERQEGEGHRNSM